MKKIAKTLALLTTIISSAFLLNGCDGNQSDTGIIVTIKSNQIMPQKEIIQEVSSETCLDGGNVYIVTADGSPKLVAWASYDPINIIGEAERESQATARINDIITQIGCSCIADDPESDVVGALKELKNNMDGSDNAKHIAIADNGIPTSGLVSFQNTNFTDFDVEAYLDDLEENNMIPDFTGYEVDFYGCGQTFSPQESLGENEKTILKNFWEGFFSRAGASVKFHDVANVTAPDESLNLPAVSTISVIGETPIKPSDYTLPEEGITFTRELLFKDNSNTLLDESAAKAVLGDIGEYLKSDKATPVYVVGTTAYDQNTQGCIERSLGRANTICLLLEDMGVSSDLLVPVGCGSDGPYYTEESGSEEISKSNRSVTIISCDSSDDTIEEIKNFITD